MLANMLFFKILIISYNSHFKNKINNPHLKKLKIDNYIILIKNRYIIYKKTLISLKKHNNGC